MCSALKPKELRPYQERMLDSISTYIREGQQRVLLDATTGCGKTTVLIAAMLHSIGLKAISHVVIAAPQNHIVETFNEPQSIQYGNTVYETTHENPDLGNRIQHYEDHSSGKVFNYLTTTNDDDLIVSCSHSALTRTKLAEVIEENASFLSGKILVVDECHHAGGRTGLGDFVDTWTKYGGAVIGASATPYRMDTAKPILEGCVRINRSYALHSAEGYAPSTLEMLVKEIQPTGGGTVIEAQETGENGVLYADATFEDTARTIVEDWLEQDRPKTIVGLPISSSKLLGMVISSLKEVGARVFDATSIGGDTKVPEKLLSLLNAERSILDYKDSEIDVIVGIQRVIEGTDWPPCSNYYMVGIPLSQVRIGQCLGRTLRYKKGIANYPSNWVDRSRMVFFANVAKRDAQAQRTAVDTSFVTAINLVDTQLGQSLLSYKTFLSKSRPVEDTTLARNLRSTAEVVDNLAMSEEKRKAIRFSLVSALVNCAKKEMTLEEQRALVLQDIERRKQQVQTPEELQILSSIEAGDVDALLIQTHPEIQQAVTERLRKKVETQKRTLRPLECLDGVKEVIDEFQSKCFTTTPDLIRRVNEHKTILTPDSIQETTRRTHETRAFPTGIPDREYLIKLSELGIEYKKRGEPLLTPPDKPIYEKYPAYTWKKYFESFQGKDVLGCLSFQDAAIYASLLSSYLVQEGPLPSPNWTFAYKGKCDNTWIGFRDNGGFRDKTGPYNKKDEKLIVAAYELLDKKVPNWHRKIAPECAASIMRQINSKREQKEAFKTSLIEALKASDAVFRRPSELAKFIRNVSV